jgi:hypothetical protein
MCLSLALLSISSFALSFLVCAGFRFLCFGVSHVMHLYDKAHFIANWRWFVQWNLKQQPEVGSLI